MTPLLDEHGLPITATVTECAALWRTHEAVYLNAWHPTALEVYIARWVTMLGDVPRCAHLDFRDTGGRTWVEVYDWSSPPHPQSTHPGVLDTWEATLARYLLTWWSSLAQPRFRWVNDHNPTRVR